MGLADLHFGHHEEHETNGTLMEHTDSHSSLNNAQHYLDNISAAINIFAVLINVLHVILLHQVPLFQKQKYFLILIQLCIPDIVMSLILCVLSLLKEPPKLVLVILFIIMQTSTICRYCALALATIERYYAVCRPFLYNTNKLVNNIRIVSLVVWITSLLVAMSKFLEVHGIIDSKIGHIVMFVFLAIPTSITSYLSVRVWMELRSMAQRNTSQQDQSLKNSSRYVLLTSAMFYSILVPFFIYVIIFSASDIPVPVDNLIMGILLIAQSMYGILNVILYAVMNTTYLAPLLTLFGLRKTRSSNISISDKRVESTEVGEVGPMTIYTIKEDEPEFPDVSVENPGALSSAALSSAAIVCSTDILLQEELSLAAALNCKDICETVGSA